MAENYKYRAFLSYSHTDLKWADWLFRELERYRVPPRLRESADAEHPLPRNLRPVFRDREELPSGSSLPQVIHDALEESEALIVICSPAAAASKWVDDEIRTFQQLGRGDRIFCLIVDGEPFAGDERECFPKALCKPVDENGWPQVSPDEPIGADARGGLHDRNHAKLMLIAGLLGIGLDELLQRDHHRRARKLFALASGATLLALIMAGLTIFAFLSQAEAERRRADAENLVGFMLGDLREDLHSIQRLDLYNSVSQKAMDYFRSLGEDDARDEALALRAEALRQLGSSRLDQADMAGALAAFNESLEISSELVTQNPSRVDWSLALAESHFYIGYVHWQRGDLEAAGAKFLDQLFIVDALATAEPGNPDRLAGSGFAWTNYGRVLELGGQYAEARQAYETVMVTFQRLMELQPEDENSRLEVGFAHNNLGKLKISLGLLDEAEQHFRSDLEIKKQVVDENPQHNLWREHLAGSHYWLGRLLVVRSALTESQAQSEAALRILDELLLTDPTMTPWRQRRAAVSTLLATGCRLGGDPECADSYISSALSDFDSLLEANPENAQWRREQGFCRLEAAWQAVLREDLAKARHLAKSAHPRGWMSDSQANADRESRKLETLVLLTLGDIARKASESEVAADSWRQASSIIEGHFDGSGDPEIIDMGARLFNRQAKLDRVRQAEEELKRIRFSGVYPRWTDSR